MIIASALLLAGGYATYTAVQNSVLIQSVLAHSTEDMAEGEDGGGGKSKCPTGGMANSKCAIWNVEYSVQFTGPIVTCNTGGLYKCTEGKCPHEN